MLLHLTSPSIQTLVQNYARTKKNQDGDRNFVYNLLSLPSIRHDLLTFFGFSRKMKVQAWVDTGVVVSTDNRDMRKVAALSGLIKPPSGSLIPIPHNPIDMTHQSDHKKNSVSL